MNIPLLDLKAPYSTIKEAYVHGLTLVNILKEDKSFLRLQKLINILFPNVYRWRSHSS